MNPKRKFLFMSTLIITLIISLIPLMQQTWATGYDPKFHIARLQTLAHNLQAGHFPNPIGFEYLHTLGYGVGFFYSNFFLYPFAILVALGCGVVKAYLAMIIIISILAIITITWTTNELFHNYYANLLAAPLYLLSNYYLTAIYTRTAIGEGWALVFIPLVILSLEKIRQNQLQFKFLLAGSMSALLLSHILTFLLACAYVLLFSLLNLWHNAQSRNLIKALCQSAAWALGLCAAFLLPFIQQYTAQKYTDTTRANDGSYQIIHNDFTLSSVFSTLFILFLLCSIYLIYQQVQHRLTARFLDQIAIIAGILTIFIYSNFLIRVAVKLFQPIVLLQTVIRFNTLILPLEVLVVAGVAGQIIAQQRQQGGILGGIFVLIVGYFFLVPITNNYQFYQQRKALIPADFSQEYSISMGEYQPAKLNAWRMQLSHDPTPSEIARHNHYRILQNNPEQLLIQTTSSAAGKTIELPRTAYRGYRYQIPQQKSQEAQFSNHGLLAIEIPPHHQALQIKIFYQPTKLALLGAVLSSVTSGFFLYCILRRKV